MLIPRQFCCVEDHVVLLARLILIRLNLFKVEL